MVPSVLICCAAWESDRVVGGMPCGELYAASPRFALLLRDGDGSVVGDCPRTESARSLHPPSVSWLVRETLSVVAYLSESRDLPCAFFLFGVGILHSMENATQLVHGTPRLAASHRTWTQWSDYCLLKGRAYRDAAGGGTFREWHVCSAYEYTD